MIEQPGTAKSSPLYHRRDNPVSRCRELSVMAHLPPAGYLSVDAHLLLALLRLRSRSFAELRQIGLSRAAAVVAKGELVCAGRRIVLRGGARRLDCNDINREAK
jgi:hypothetical protein